MMASSARGLQLTHHCGLSTGSMTSPDLLQIGICIGLSFVSMYNPAGLQELTAAFPRLHWQVLVLAYDLHDTL